MRNFLVNSTVLMLLSGCYAQNQPRPKVITPNSNLNKLESIVSAPLTNIKVSATPEILRSNSNIAVLKINFEFQDSQGLLTMCRTSNEILDAPDIDGDALNLNYVRCLIPDYLVLDVAWNYYSPYSNSSNFSNYQIEIHDLTENFQALSHGDSTSITFDALLNFDDIWRLGLSCTPFYQSLIVENVDTSGKFGQLQDQSVFSCPSQPGEEVDFQDLMAELYNGVPYFIIFGGTFSMDFNAHFYVDENKNSFEELRKHGFGDSAHIGSNLFPTFSVDLTSPYSTSVDEENGHDDDPPRQPHFEPIPIQ